MSWNLNTLFEFYENQKSNPAEYNRLTTVDPTGRIMAAYLTASQSYKDALAEHQALGEGAFSLDPTRSSELEEIMTSTLVTRTTMLSGLENCILAVGDQPEPTVRYLQARIVGMKRGRGTSRDIDAIQGVIDALDVIVAGCFA